MKTILLILALAAVAYSGQIYSWADANAQDFQTNGSPSITLYFSVDTSITSGFLRIALPFAIADGWTGSVSYGQVSTRCAEIASPSSATAVKGDGGAAYVPISLTAKTNYALTLSLGKPSTAPTAGLSSIIGLSTVTFTSANYIVIDSNPTFADLEWAADSVSGMVVSFVADDLDKNNIATTHNVKFSFTPTSTNYVGGATIKVFIDNSEFLINSAAWESLDAATPVPATWTDSAKINKNAFTINIPTTLVANQKVGLKLNILNPNKITSAKVSVKIYRRQTGQLVEEGTSAESFVKSVYSATTLASSSIATAYGAIQSSGPLRLFYGSAAGAFYQTYRFNFKVNAVPKDFISTVTLSIATDADILFSSLVHNLDSTSKKALCKIGTDNSLVCENVALATTSYVIGLKIKLKSTFSPPGDFGKLKITMKNPDGSTIASPDDTLLATVALQSSLSFTALDAMATASKLETAAGVLAVIDTTTALADSNLKYTFTPAVAVDTNTLVATFWGSTATTAGSGAGFEFIFNKYITQAPSFAYSGKLEKTAGATVTSVKTLSAAGHTKELVDNYTRIRTSLDAVAETSVALANTDTLSITLAGYQLSKGPTLRADEGTFEMYLGFALGLGGTTVTYNKYHFYSNNYIISAATSLENIAVQLVGGHIGDSTGGRAPNLLRVYGSLVSENAKVGKLAIFFTYLAPYDLNATADTVQCFGSQGTAAGVPTCTFVAGKDVAVTTVPSTIGENMLFYHRIEISWSNLTAATVANPFQILIPVVITTATASMVDPYIGILDSTNALVFFGRGKSGNPVAVATGNAPFKDTATPPAQIATLNVEIDNTADKIGQAVGAKILKLTSTNALITGANVFKINTYSGNAWIVNTGIQYCAAWNFYGNVSFLANTAQPASGTEEKCLTYGLSIASGSVTTRSVPLSTTNKWCVFCPVGAALTFSGANIVTITNYTVWNGGSSWTSGALSGVSPAYGCVYNGGDSVAEALGCDDSLKAAFTGNITSLAFTPSTLTGGSVSNRVIISFTLANAIAKVPTSVAASTGVKFYIRQNATLFDKDANSACSAVLGGATYTCTFSPQTADSTLVPATAEDLIASSSPSIVSIDALTSTTPFTTVNITLDGINPKVSTATTVQVQVSSRVIYGSTVNLFMDVSPTTNFAISAAPTTASVPELSGIKYSNPVKGARGTLRINFKPTGREIYKGEQFQILFASTSIATNNNQSSLLCEVYDSANNAITHFSTCVISTESITLTAKADVPATVNPYVLLRGFLTVDFNKTSLGARLLSVGGTAVQTTANPVTNSYYAADPIIDSAGITALGDVNITRYATVVGGSSIIQFPIINRNSSINSAARILISFPNSYSPKLTDNMLQVQINGKPTYYTIPEDRLLQISPNAVIAKDAPIVIRVIGVALPKFTAAGQFWIAIDNDANNGNGFLQAGFASDPTFADPASPVPVLIPINVSFSTPSAVIPQIRATGSLLITVLNRIAISKGAVVSLAFPKSWTGLLSTSPAITCNAQAIALNATAGTAAAAVATFGLVVGNTIKLNVTADIANSSQINITCSSVRMPDAQFDGDCLSQSPTITVFDGPLEATVVTRSSPSTHHIPRTAPFAKVDTLVYLNWPTADNIRIPQGTTQVKESPSKDDVYVRLPSGATPFAQQVSLKLATKPDGVSLIETTGVANVGETQLFVGLQALPTAALGVAAITFDKTETALGGATTTNKYASPAALFVEVTTDKASVQASLPASEVPVPVGGYSYPIVYRSSHAPCTDVTYTVGGDSTVLLFSAAGAQASTVTLPAGKKEFALIVQVQSNAAVGAKMQIFVNASSSTNPAFTASPNNVTIIAANPLTESPTMNLTHDAANTLSNQQQQVVSVKIGTTNASNTIVPAVTLYWACALTPLGLNRDLVFVRQVLSAVPVPYPGESFGTKTLSAPGSSDFALVDRLLANSNYTCRFWATNQGNQTTSATIIIKTPSNNGKVGRVLVEYNADTFTDPDTMIGKTLCSISSTLLAPPHLIRALSGQMCGQPRGIWNPEYLRYNTSNVSSVVVVPIYFLTNNMVMEDKLYTDVIAKLAALNTDAKKVVTAINSIYSPVATNTTAPVLPEPEVVNGTSTSPVTITFKPPGNNNISIAHVGVWTWTWSNTSTNPTWAEFNPYNPNRTLVAAGATYFNGSAFAPQKISLNITFAAGTTYALFYAGTCENPSEQSSDCASSIVGPIIVSNTGANPTSVDSGTGSTSDSRVLTFSMSFIVALLLSIFM